MKKFYLVILLLVTTAHSQSISEAGQYRKIGLVWGLMKYKHPIVSAGQHDWDKVLIEMTGKISGQKAEAEFDSGLLDFIRQYDRNSGKYSPMDPSRKSVLFSKNNAFAWIDGFTKNNALMSSLRKLELNKNFRNYYADLNAVHFVTFNNEKAIAGFDHTNRSHRLLYFFRLWNTMQYWNVNLYLNDTRWIDVLDRMLPQFISGSSEVLWDGAVLNLTSYINDSHTGGYQNELLTKNYEARYPAIEGLIINDSIVVTAVNNRPRAEEDGIIPGDVITHIDGVPYKDFLNRELRPVMSFSNDRYLYKMLNRFRLIFGGNKKVQVRTLSNLGAVEDIELRQYSDLKWDTPYGLRTDYATPVVRVDEDILYVNLGTVENNAIEEIFKTTLPKSLILDLRNYPQKLARNFASYLLPHRALFAKALTPHSPGFGEYDVKRGLHKIIDIYKTGSRNPDHFKGRIVLLVNSSTASLSEQYGMQIQMAPQVITIGSQTAGAVLSVTSCTMPDGSSVTFTYAGAFYPDGTGVQRKGLKIDHYVRESARHYDRDLYIKEAIRILRDELTSLNKIP